MPPHVFVYSLGKEDGESRLKYLFRFYKSFAHIFFTVRVDFVFFHMGAIFNILAAPFFCIRKFYKTQFFWWKAHGHINTVGKFALVFVDRAYTSTESGFAIQTFKRHVIGQAVDGTVFTPPQLSAIRNKEVIFVGRIMPVKRIEDFIDTAKILNARDSEIIFTIVGPTDDIAYLKTLKDRCVSLSLQDCIQFVGPKTQTELVHMYQHATIFLNTSVTHSMDKTVLESILCGCIPVTGNRAFSSLLEDTGLYINNATPALYAEMVNHHLQNPITLLQTALRDTVLALHSLDTFAERIFKV